MALSLLAGIAVYWTFLNLYKPVPVVLAAHNIDPLKPIKETDLVVGSTAQRDRHPQAFIDPRQVVGSYSAVSIFKGQQIIAPQVVRDPGKMVVSAQKVGVDETLLSLKSQEASWPPVLRTGDLVTVVAVYPEQTVEIGVGTVVSTSGGSVVQDIKNIRDAQSQPSGSQIIISMKFEDAKKTVEAVKTAKGVYLFPRHPGLGGE